MSALAPFALLAIDCGQQSGYALFAPSGILILSGTTAKRAQGRRVEVCRRAADNARLLQVDLVIARERPNGRWKSALTAYGAGASWGWWEAAVMEAIPALPPNRIIKVNQSAWASGTIGAGGSSEEKKARAMAYARAAFPSVEIMSHDQADALCIGRYVLNRGTTVAKRSPRWHR